MIVEWSGLGWTLKHSCPIMRTTLTGEYWQIVHDEICYYSPALEGLTDGLRALNDAPMPKQRIWANIYKNEVIGYYSESRAKALAYRNIALEIAVPFVRDDGK